MFPGRIAFLVFVFALLAAPSWAQQTANVVANCGTPNSTYSANQNAPVTQDTTGSGCIKVGGGVAPAPVTGTPTETSVSCANTTTTLLAAAAATQFILIKVPSTATNTVWFNFAGASATTAAPSVDLTVGQSISWTTFVPTAQINCIAGSSTTVTVVYK